MNHGIQFPTSSERWRSEIELRKKLNSDFRYMETDLAHLLNEFYEQQRGDGSTEEEVLVLERILYGLNVTTTSLPDMTVLRDGYIFFGEFKNSEKCSLEHATKQCTLYLYALLYFFRVRLGMPVKAVFGFVEFPAATIGMIAKRAKDCYQELYCVDPVGDASFGIFLMNDCGTVLHRSETFAELGYPKFLVLYRDLWMRTIKMCKFFLHGDALPHNIVYNEDDQKLVLIDLDEGTYGTKAPKRVVERVDGLQYQYLRYPNFYRAWTNRTVYTQLQLVASFLLILPLFEDTSENEMLISLRSEAAAADSFFKDENQTDPTGSRGTPKGVSQLITRMEEVLEPQASS